MDIRKARSKGHLSGFAGSGFPNDDQDLVLGDGVDETLPVIVHRQQRASMLERLKRGSLLDRPLFLFVHFVTLINAFTYAPKGTNR